MGTTVTVEYDSSTSRLTIPSELRALVRYRDLLWLLILKTIKTRYKRSALGVAWTLLNPLINMVVMTVAFSTLFRTAVPRYSVYLLVGLTAWTFFSQSTAYAMGQLVWGSTLLKRVYIPPTIFAVACVGNGLVNLAFSLAPLLVIMIVLGHPLYATWWFLPVAVLILSLFSLGVALLMSTFAVLFVDTVDMYQLFLQAWFFLTPIFYPKEILGKEYAWLVDLNPMFHMIELMRLPLYEGVLPSLHTLLISCTWAAAALWIGAWTFTRKADEFAYRT